MNNPNIPIKSFYYTILNFNQALFKLDTHTYGKTKPFKFQLQLKVESYLEWKYYERSSDVDYIEIHQIIFTSEYVQHLISVNITSGVSFVLFETDYDAKLIHRKIYSLLPR